MVDYGFVPAPVVPLLLLFLFALLPLAHSTPFSLLPKCSPSPPIVAAPHHRRRSTRGPPHEQLLVRLVAGGVPFVVVGARLMVGLHRMVEPSPY
jgi:hypothetical protein